MVKIALETQRLFLRHLEAADLDFVAEMLGNAEVMRFWPRAMSRAEAEEWIVRQQERYARDGFGYWLALYRATGQPVGQAGLLAVHVDGQREISLGYILHRPYWGRGFATEAGLACRDMAYETYDAARVIALIRPENIPSRRVADRMGMRPEQQVSYATFQHLVYVAGRSYPALRTSDG